MDWAGEERDQGELRNFDFDMKTSEILSKTHPWETEGKGKKKNTVKS